MHVPLRPPRLYQKILSLARVMIFWKSRFACNYSSRENIKLRYPKNRFYVPSLENHLSKSSETWFIPSLGENLQILFCDLRNFMGQKLPKNGGYIWIFELSGPVKSVKSKISQIHEPIL